MSLSANEITEAQGFGIGADICAGNIDIVDARDPAAVRLAIRRDTNSHFFQWFYFYIDRAADQPLSLTIENASEAAYPDGWMEYHALASDDGENWRRVPTHYSAGELVISVTPRTQRCYIAYFVPYSMDRHRNLIAGAAAQPGIRHEVLGQTHDGQPIDLLMIDDDLPADKRAKKSVWMIARQHPGETMAEWWMEGALEMLCDRSDPVARALRQQCRLYIVPNMNPDGSARGHLRTNAKGVNLNRAWAEPSLEQSPEVYHVRQRMQDTGVDFHMDIHGDEGLPYNFLAGFEGIKAPGEAQLAGYNAFEQALDRLSPDFQTEFGYPKALEGSSNLRKATDYVAATFECPAFTLEMPFKDNLNLSDPVEGWSPARCKHLARHCLQALYLIRDQF